MATNIVFDEGLREYTINGDEKRVIKVNTSDFSIIDRWLSAEQDIKDYVDKVGEVDADEDGLKVIGELKQFIYDKIDYIFNAKVSDIVFNGANPLSTSGGVMLFERFLDAFMPVIQKDLNDEQKKSEKRIKTYTDEVKKYKNKK